MKISIITVTLNSQQTIGNTIRSVISQSYPAIEYLIIDGGSTDGTLEIINAHRQQITCLISETDQGIYDAMNKGVCRATGDVIGILNADDIYADNLVLQRVADCFQQTTAEACYGDLAYVSPENPAKVIRFWKAGGYTRYRMYCGWMPPHPTFFVRSRCYKRYGYYRTDIGSSADYELMLRFLLCQKITASYIPHLLVRMRGGGVSNRSLVCRLRAHIMDWKAWAVNGLVPFPWTLPMKPIRKCLQWILRN